MLTIKNVVSSAAGEAYFRKDAAVSKEHYYTEKGLIQDAAWWGRGAVRLDLVGAVHRDAFARLLDGKLPNGEPLACGDAGSDAPNRRARVVAEHHADASIGSVQSLHDTKTRGTGRSKPTPNNRSRRRPGFDLTFSASKSVSMAALLGGDPDVVAAHDRAVEAALRFLEQTAVDARKTVNGVTTAVQTDNLIVARFRHETSREKDPQLHTHCVVMNATQRHDDKWCAIWNGELYRRQRMATAVYRSELARDLSTAGYGIVVRSGAIEIDGVDRDAMALFSKRRDQIRQHLQSHGEHGAAAAQRAAYKTRRSKENVSPAQLQGQWRHELDAAGLDWRFAAGERSVARAQSRDATAADAKAREAVAWAIEHLVERRSILPRDDVRRTALERGTGHVVLAEIDVAVQAAVGKGALITLPRAPVGDHERHEVLYTTPELVRMERQMIALMRRNKGTSEPVGAASEIETPARNHGLSPMQRKAAETLVASRDLVVAVHGFAGAGKTRSLVVLREVAERAGWTVRGFAPSAAAAQVLATDMGAKTTTLARHLIDTKRPDKQVGGGRELWVLDEAGMVSTKQMRDLLLAAMSARKHGTMVRVVVVGDTRQLASIEAGCPFKLLSAKGMRTATLNEIKRQSPESLIARLVEQGAAPEIIGKRSQVAQALRDAVKDVADTARGKAAFERLRAAGCVFDDKTMGNSKSKSNSNSNSNSNSRSRDTREPEDPDEARIARLKRIAEDYLSRPRAVRAETLVLTPANGARRKLNELIREGLQAKSELGADASVGCNLVRVDMTRAQQRIAEEYRPGQVVRFARAHKQLQVAGGEYLRVTDVVGARVIFQRLSHVGVVGQSDRVVWEPNRERVEVYTQEERALAVGDRLKWTRRDDVSGLANGHEVEVRVLRGGDRMVVRRVGGTEDIHVNLNDLRQSHWDHAYATTVHASQGKTSDYVVAHLPSENRYLLGSESFYVAISRARFGARIYTDSAERVADEFEKSQSQQSAVQELQGGRRDAGSAGKAAGDRVTSASASASAPAGAASVPVETEADLAHVGVQSATAQTVRSADVGFGR